MNSQTFTGSQSGEDSVLSINQAQKSIRPSRNRSLVSNDIKDEILRSASIRSTEPRYDMDFDALFSSSPVAQSTPRLRLEPSFENDSSKRLKNLRADSRSLFDRNSPKYVHFSEGDVTPQHNGHKGNTTKRINSHVKVLDPAARNHLSKRRKRHPSPSKDELENLEDALKHYSPLVGPVDPRTEDDLTTSYGELRPEGVLQPRTNNMLLRIPAKRGIKGSVSSSKDKLGQSMPNSSVAEPAKRLPNKFQRPSMAPKLAGAATLGRRPEYLAYQLLPQQDGSLLATDELQWDSTTYNVGMKRA